MPFDDAASAVWHARVEAAARELGSATEGRSVWVIAVDRGRGEIFGAFCGEFEEREHMLREQLRTLEEGRWEMRDKGS